MEVVAKFRSFPEYHLAYLNLTDNRNKEEKISLSTGSAFGQDYDNFIPAQPESLRDPLKDIQNQGKTYSKIYQDFHEMTDEFYKNFETFNALFAEKKKKQQDLESAENAATKAEAKAEAKPNPIMAKFVGDPAENERKLREEAASLREQATKQKEEFSQYNSNYVPQFTDTFVSMMDSYFESRCNQLHQLVDVANNLTKAANKIDNFEDPFLDKFERTLERLNASSAKQ